MYIALLAYSAYVLNATQFLLKLRAARLEGAVAPPQHSPTLATGVPS
jgi:3-vinyl bacteriochlorophyllide hydratase